MMTTRLMSFTAAMIAAISCVGLAQESVKPPTAPAPATPAPAAPAKAPPPADILADGGTMVEYLREEAARVMPHIKCDGVKRFLINTSWLPLPDTRKVYWDKAGKVALAAADYEKLADDAKAAFKLLELDQEFYYKTRYGSPLAYARALDIACKEMACKECFRKKKIFDFGYGGIGHLRLLASCGASVTGVEVDPILKVLYSDPKDTGEIAGAGMGDNIPPAGSLKLVHGQWPADSKVKEEVGGGYDLIISKNVLKNGYIHSPPEKQVDKRMLIDLGVDDKTFMEAIAASLNEGGLFLIYNISPKQNEDKYIPWADGRCPFSKETIKAAGLEVLDFDADDTVEVRALGHALRWHEGEGSMDLERDCFAHYTLIRKPVLK